MQPFQKYHDLHNAPAGLESHISRSLTSYDVTCCTSSGNTVVPIVNIAHN